MSGDPRWRGKLGAQLRQDEALRLKVAEGYTFAQIATTLGYANHSGAHHAYTAALRRHQQVSEELAELGRQIAIERYSLLWDKAVRNALDEEGGAKDLLAAAQIADRLARLEGVKDPATEVRLTVESQLDRDIAELTEALTRHGIPVAQVLDADRQ